jgi:hypothetical protein
MCWEQEALGLGDAPPMEAPALAAEALADGRNKRDAELALEVFAAAGSSFTESYRCGCVLFDGSEPPLPHFALLVN